jgi:hypothetical protein
MSCHRNNGARRALSILLCATGAALSVGATTAQAAGAYYETFGGLGIAAGKLDNPSYGYGQGSVSGNATNVAAGGGYVYWQDGVNIWRANSDLSGAAIWHVNGLSPTDFTIDVAAGAYYETFGGLEIAAGKLDNPSYGYGQGSVSGNATNVAAGGGYVYWQDGVNIWRANSDLSGAAIWHVNGLSPTDFTIDPARAVAPVPEPAAWTLMLAGFGAIGLIARRRRAMLAA